MRACSGKIKSLTIKYTGKAAGTVVVKDNAGAEAGLQVPQKAMKYKAKGDDAGCEREYDNCRANQGKKK